MHRNHAVSLLVAVALTLGSGGAAASPARQEAASAAGDELAQAVSKARAKLRIVSVAVPAFSEAGAKAKGLGEAVAEEWGDALAKGAELKVVDRARIKRLVGGKRAAEVAKGDRAELKKLLAAHVTLVGTVEDKGGELFAEAQLIHNPTGEVLATSRQSLSPKPEPAVAALTPPEPEPAPQVAALTPAPEAKAEPKTQPDPSAQPEPKAEAKPEPKPAQTPAKDAPPKTVEAQADPAEADDAPRSGGVESSSVQIEMRKLADKLAAAFAKLPGKARYRRLAIVPFQNIGDDAKEREIGAIVTAEVATFLRRDHGMLLVERAQLAAVFDELKLQAMTVEDLSKAPDLGKLADVQALIIGSVAEAGDRYLINARLVVTENASTLAAESVSVAKAGMVALASDAVVLRSRSGAVFRSLLIPGWGQFYNRQAWKGWGFIGLEVAALGGALAFQLAGNSAYDDYKSLNTADQLGEDPSAKASELYDTASSRYRTRNVLLGVAAGLWAINVIDAFASGVDGESMLAGGVATRPGKLTPTVALTPGGGHLQLQMAW